MLRRTYQGKIQGAKITYNVGVLWTSYHTSKCWLGVDSRKATATALIQWIRENTKWNRTTWVDSFIYLNRHGHVRGRRLTLFINTVTIRYLNLILNAIMYRTFIDELHVCTKYYIHSRTLCAWLVWASSWLGWSERRLRASLIVLNGPGSRPDQTVNFLSVH